MNSILTLTNKNRFISFIWQHILLIVSLFILTLGVALCIRSELGSSVISSTPLVFNIAGRNGLAPALSLGDYTIILNAFLVVGQILVLRRQYQPIQLLQLVIGFVFGFMIDLNMALTSYLSCGSLATQALTQLAGCTVMGIGVALEVRCGSITMPGEGLPVAISRVTDIPFAKAKIAIDCLLVLLAVAGCYVFFGQWKWNIVGMGTLFAMVYVGFVVRTLDKHMGWFDRILLYNPGCRRYLYGLARFLHSKIS